MAIDIPEVLVHLRRRVVEETGSPRGSRARLHARAGLGVLVAVALRARPAPGAGGQRTARAAARPAQRLDAVARAPGGAPPDVSPVVAQARMSAAREEVLRRVRAALRDVPAGEQREIPRPYRRSLEGVDVVERFAERVADYRATVRRVAAGEVAAVVAEACAARGAARLAIPADLPVAWRPEGVELLEDDGLLRRDAGRRRRRARGLRAGHRRDGDDRARLGTGAGPARPHPAARLVHVRRGGRADRRLGAGGHRRAGGGRARGPADHAGLGPVGDLRHRASPRRRRPRPPDARRAPGRPDDGLRESERRVLQVAGHQLGVAAVQREQLLVGAALDQAAVVEDHDLLGVADGREPVGDRDRGPALRQLVERGLHRPLGLGVQRAGGLVEDEHGRVAQDRAGDRDALLLAAREAVAALADDGVVALGQRGDQVVDASGAGGRLDLLVGGVGTREAQVLRAPWRGRGRSPGRPRRRSPPATRSSRRARRRRRCVTAPALDVVEAGGQVAERGLARRRSRPRSRCGCRRGRRGRRRSSVHGPSGS